MNKSDLLNQAFLFGAEARANHRKHSVPNKDDREDLIAVAGVKNWGDIPLILRFKIYKTFAEGYDSEEKFYL
ncbi:MULTISPECIES: hypothetical protein [Nostocales]|uniref:Uncharacterized protein n=1 Tax=Tolypothrix campylonemoides VB511288_2 TaxID=3232311 RepID=A0ABW8XPA6_9CYAN